MVALPPNNTVSSAAVPDSTTMLPPKISPPLTLGARGGVGGCGPCANAGVAAMSESISQRTMNHFVFM
jgi:hypothetical protein